MKKMLMESHKEEEEEEDVTVQKSRDMSMQRVTPILQQED